MRCFSPRVWIVGLLTNCGASISYGGLSGNGSCHHVPTIVLLLWCVNPHVTPWWLFVTTPTVQETMKENATQLFSITSLQPSPLGLFFSCWGKTTRLTENLTCSKSKVCLHSSCCLLLLRHSREYANDGASHSVVIWVMWPKQRGPRARGGWGGSSGAKGGGEWSPPAPVCCETEPLFA